MKYLAMETPTTAEVDKTAALPLPADGDRKRGRKRVRRSWTIEQKLAIVREVEETGDAVAAVARRHEMNANYLFLLMKQAREGRLGGRPQPLSSETSVAAFIDLGVISSEGQDVEPEGSAAHRHGEGRTTSGQAVPAGGRMEIVGANGRRVIVDRTVDVAVLMRLLRGLETLR
ncbi:transposase [Mesorhizobium sp. M1B.F.Ca.ET.045.04.1.1]|uniref:transposase n=1 Tax=Mesorhizobium sp. M1B.F.Ca.ET.045.04.1.1 TaxID=2493673 RepID=UPI001FDEE3D5|nr:transposase [Mesorhizobium sp. M1B.F.Ca.ET.045.04.1.1]